MNYEMCLETKPEKRVAFLCEVVMSEMKSPPALSTVLSTWTSRIALDFPNRLLHEVLGLVQVALRIVPNVLSCFDLPSIAEQALDLSHV